MNQSKSLVVMGRALMMLQVTHFVHQFFFKYRVRCWMLMSGIEAWIRWRSCWGWHWRWCRWMVMVMNNVDRGPGMNWIGWINVDRWLTRLIHRDVRNVASSADRNESHQVQRQTISEDAEVLTVDQDSVLRWIRSDCDLERLMSLHWHSSVTLFGSGNQTFAVIADDDVFLRTDVDAEHHIISRFQCCTALQVHNKPKRVREATRYQLQLQLFALSRDRVTNSATDKTLTHSPICETLNLSSNFDRLTHTQAAGNQAEKRRLRVVDWNCCHHF